MFDLEDVDNAKLTSNKTTGKSFLRGKRIRNLIADGNEAGIGNDINNGFSGVVKKIVIGVVIVVVGSFAIFVINKWFPGFK